jgi:hypothetical protein
MVNESICKVCSIKNEQDSSQPSSIGYEYNASCQYEMSDSEHVKALAISDELLKELGFTFHTYHKLWQHVKPQRTITVELDKDYTAVDFSHRPLLKNVQYVHRLQNLFYSLQGLELLFKKTTSKSNYQLA